MNPEWKSFLIDAGAEFIDTKVSSFGNLEQEIEVAGTGTVVSDLSQYGLISIDGDDKHQFLQGQLTNDINLVDLTHSQYSSLCNPKGRMIANFRVFQRDDTVYLRLPKELLATTLNQMKKFVLRSKVSLEDASDSLIGLGVSGNQAVAYLENLTSSVPVNTDDVMQHEHYTIVRIPGIEPRFEIYGLISAMVKIWETLHVHATAVGANTWELLNIESGIPEITSNTLEAFVPQMTNMHLINGLNFKKGCYTGQEIIARLHYLGKLKRRLYLVEIDTDVIPSAGEVLVTDDSTSKQTIGTIVNAQVNQNKKISALAVIEIKSAETQSIKLSDSEGPAIKLLDLPYDTEH